MWNEPGRSNGTFTNAIIPRVRPVAEVACALSAADQNRTISGCMAPETDRKGLRQHLWF